VNRLLILSCSQSKTGARVRVPAIDRYDGPAFRVLRKYLREGPTDAPTVLILSAKYGLIDSTMEIPDYDRRMSRPRAAELRPTVLKGLSLVMKSKSWHSIGVCVGKVYRSALDGMDAIVPENARVEILGGGQGTRLANLRRWLRHERQNAGRSGCLQGGENADQAR
jgi:hypothetical protein